MQRSRGQKPPTKSCCRRLGLVVGHLDMSSFPHEDKHQPSPCLVCRSPLQRRSRPESPSDDIPSHNHLLRGRRVAPAGGVLQRTALAQDLTRGDVLRQVAARDRTRGDVLQRRGQPPKKGFMCGGRGSKDNMEPMYMPYKALKKITDDFCAERKIGQGTFGLVYKGGDKDSQEIAVKVLKIKEEVNDKDFEREFNNLAKLKHQNIIQLLGYCSETEEVIAPFKGKQTIVLKVHRALCFEYMPNGSLEKKLSDEDHGFGWHKRYRIIKGTCEGLKYLHMGMETPVYHLDLKPGNILLDKNLLPKIADFGLSRLMGKDNTKETISAVGTLGYLPPEYINYQIISKEFDIYSLGVIIIKIIVGAKGYPLISEMGPVKFCEHVCNKWRKRLEVIPGYTLLKPDCQQVQKCIEIALKCIGERKERPTIDYIVNQLNETENHTNDTAWIEEFGDREFIPLKSNIPLWCPQDVSIKSSESEQSLASTLPAELPLNYLKEITNGFSEERIISKGVFGTVYKGILENGQVMAVNRLVVNSLAAKSFLNAATKLVALHHENIVKLLGCCREATEDVVEHEGNIVLVDTNELLLCYEYLPKGSLSDYLLDDANRTDWDTRFKIIKGICQGLHFLHRETVYPVVHLDLQTSNILLDDNMVPKISEFALSRFFSQEETRMQTLNVVGAVGFMAPEYLHNGEISDKCDIYSLGVLIIRITIGMEICSNDADMDGRGFISDVRETWTDEHIASECRSLDADRLMQVKTCIKVGLMCADVNQGSRPSIVEIIDMLYGRYAGDMVPKIDSIPAKLLDVYPTQLRVPFKSNKLIARSLQLTNNTDDRIAVRLMTKCAKRYMTKMPVCAVVPPMSTYTFIVTRSDQKKQPEPNNNDEFLTLESSVVREGDIGLKNRNLELNNFFKEAKEGAAEVYELKLKVISDPPEEETSGQPLQSEIEIISNRKLSQVLSVDVHPTEPWILTSNEAGEVVIWDYKAQIIVHPFDFTQKPVYSAKFIEREKWLVAGDGVGTIYVYSYDTKEEVKEIDAHEGEITSLAVHPTDPFVLSSSQDHQIKLWDWTMDWQWRTFEGHSNTVTQVNFNTTDTNTFASASLDSTIKIWSISSSGSKKTLSGHPDGLLCVHNNTSDFQNYLITGSRDGTAQIWDIETETCVQTLIGHLSRIGSVYRHIELPIVITGSHDGTLRLWNSATYRLENIIDLNLGAVRALGYIKSLGRLVIGCHQGIAIMEINVP